MPVRLATPLALVISAIVALALAVSGAVAVDSLLDEFRGVADLSDSFLAFFYVAPAIAILGLVSCFSTLINWHHAASWRAPTFAFALGATLVWAWARDFGGIGFAWYLPGTIAWPVSCWFFHRNASAHPEYVIET
jgi:hypothetical protein